MCISNFIYSRVKKNSDFWIEANQLWQMQGKSKEIYAEAAIFEKS